MTILTPSEMAQWERLRFTPRKTFSARTRGERLTRQKGTSIEFADYRDYSDGDDLRHLDWTILARLGRPTIRTYQDEAELPVYLAVDVSPSMNFGDPTKLEHAQRLAEALGFIALAGGDRLQTMAIGASPVQPARPLRGRGSFLVLHDWVTSLRPNGTRPLAQSLSRLPALAPGLLLLISDGLDPEAAGALRSISARGHELAMVQVLSPIEIDPDLEGDLRLVDSETGAAVEITAHSQTLQIYKRNLEEHCRVLAEAVNKLGGRLLLSPAGQPLDDFLASGLRRVGLVE